MILLQRIGLEIWNKWQKSDTQTPNRLIFNAVVIIAVVMLGVKIVSAAKDIIVAATFGTSDIMDAFLIAYLLPIFVSSVITGMFNAALIPTYIQVQERAGQAAAQRLFSNMVTISSGLLVIVTILLAVTGPYCLLFIAPGFNIEKQILTQRLFYVLLPIILISGLAANWSSVLNAGHRFALAAIAPMAIPLASVVFLLLMSAKWSIYALAIGIVGGYTLELCLLGYALRRQGISILPRWSGIDEPLRQVLGQSLPMLAGGILMNSAGLVDQAMASYLAPGSVSALGYGSKLVTLISTIAISALGTAVLPYLSKMVAVADWSGVRRTIRTYTLLTLMVTIPISCFLIVFSRFIIRITFQRGAFSEMDTDIVAQIQAMYALQIPFYTLVILYVRLISSLRVNYILMWGTIISFVVNVVFDYELMKFMGISGIALSTTIVYVVNLCFVATLAYRMLGKRQVDSCA